MGRLLDKDAVRGPRHALHKTFKDESVASADMSMCGGALTHDMSHRFTGRVAASAKSRTRCERLMAKLIVAVAVLVREPPTVKRHAAAFFHEGAALVVLPA